MYVMFWDYWQQAMKVQDPVIFTTQIISWFSCHFWVVVLLFLMPSTEVPVKGFLKLGILEERRWEIQIQVAEICSNFHGFSFPQKWWVHGKKTSKEFRWCVFVAHFHLPRALIMTSIFEGQPPQNKAEIPIKTMVIRVLGRLRSNRYES